MEHQIQSRIDKWLEGNYDEATKSVIREMTVNNTNELADAFYKNLEFGTGGLRGIMGIGTNRINRYTIGMATQLRLMLWRQMAYMFIFLNPLDQHPNFLLPLGN